MTSDPDSRRIARRGLPRTSKCPGVWVSSALAEQVGRNVRPRETCEPALPTPQSRGRTRRMLRAGLPAWRISVPGQTGTHERDGPSRVARPDSWPRRQWLFVPRRERERCSRQPAMRLTAARPRWNRSTLPECPGAGRPHHTSLFTGAEPKFARRHQERAQRSTTAARVKALRRRDRHVKPASSKAASRGTRQGHRWRPRASPHRPYGAG